MKKLRYFVEDRIEEFNNFKRRHPRPCHDLFNKLKIVQIIDLCLSLTVLFVLYFTYQEFQQVVMRYNYLHYLKKVDAQDYLKNTKYFRQINSYNDHNSKRMNPFAIQYDIEEFINAVDFQLQIKSPQQDYCQDTKIHAKIYQNPQQSIDLPILCQLKRKNVKGFIYQVNIDLDSTTIEQIKQKYLTSMLSPTLTLNINSKTQDKDIVQLQINSYQHNLYYEDYVEDQFTQNFMSKSGDKKSQFLDLEAIPMLKQQTNDIYGGWLDFLDGRDIKKINDEDNYTRMKFNIQQRNYFESDNDQQGFQISIRTIDQNIQQDEDQQESGNQIWLLQKQPESLIRAIYMFTGGMIFILVVRLLVIWLFKDQIKQVNFDKTKLVLNYSISQIEKYFEKRLSKNNNHLNQIQYQQLDLEKDM